MNERVPDADAKAKHSGTREGNRMNRWIVRPLRPEELSKWLPLWQGYQRFYEVQISGDVSELTWKRFHDPAEPMHVLGAFGDEAVSDAGGEAAGGTGSEGDEAAGRTRSDGDGPLVGIVHYIFHRSCWTPGPYCYLQDLYTVPEQRGRGVGRALIEAVYEKAAESGASRVWWLTQESNRAGRLLYDKLADQPGFIQYRKSL
jgi:GNAT superfamily N-acetyltransferase